jgi:hypothetical protein
LVTDGKTKYSELHGSEHSPNLICSLHLRECSYDVSVVPKYFNFATISTHPIPVIVTSLLYFCAGGSGADKNEEAVSDGRLLV